MINLAIDKLPDWSWLANNIGFDKYVFGGLPENVHGTWTHSIFIESEKIYLHLSTNEELYLLFVLRWS